MLGGEVATWDLGRTLDVGTQMPSRPERSTFGTAVHHVHHRSSSLRSPLPVIVLSCNAAILNVLDRPMQPRRAIKPCIHPNPCSGPLMTLLIGLPVLYIGRTTSASMCFLDIARIQSVKSVSMQAPWTPLTSQHQCYTAEHASQTTICYSVALSATSVPKF